jgi:hypothetical protein
MIGSPPREGHPGLSLTGAGAGFISFFIFHSSFLDSE